MKMDIISIYTIQSGAGLPPALQQGLHQHSSEGPAVLSPTNH